MIWDKLLDTHKHTDTQLGQLGSCIYLNSPTGYFILPSRKCQKFCGLCFCIIFTLIGKCVLTLPIFLKKKMIESTIHFICVIYILVIISSSVIKGNVLLMCQQHRVKNISPNAHFSGCILYVIIKNRLQHPKRFGVVPCFHQTFLQLLLFLCCWAHWVTASIVFIAVVFKRWKYKTCLLANTNIIMFPHFCV